MSMFDNSASGDTSQEAYREVSQEVPLLQHILPDRCFVPDGSEQIVADHLRAGRSVIVVGESGVGKTATCKAALTQLGDQHLGLHLQRMPRPDDLSSLYRWILGLKRHAVIFMDEVRMREGMNCQKLTELLSSGRDWLHSEPIQGLLAIRPDTFDELDRRGLFDVLSPWEVVRIQGVDHDVARSIIEKLSPSTMGTCEAEIEEHLTNCQDQYGTIRPIHVIGLCAHLRHHGKTDKSKYDPLSSVYHQMKLNLAREELQALIICEQLCNFAGCCPEKLLLSITHRLLPGDAAKVIQSLELANLLRQERHPIYSRVFSIHDSHAGLATASANDRDFAFTKQEAIDLAAAHQDACAFATKNRLKRDGTLHLNDLKELLETYCFMFDLASYPPKLKETLADTHDRYPPLGGEEITQAYLDLSHAMDEFYGLLIDGISSETDKVRYASLCASVSEYVVLYEHLVSEGLRLRRPPHNLAHETGQLPHRWLITNGLYEDDSAPVRLVKSITHKWLPISAQRHEHCANAITEIGPFDRGMYLRTAAWDYMFCDRHEDASRCFDMAAMQFLQIKSMRLLAAECYRAWGAEIYKDRGIGLRQHLKAFHLRYEEQDGVSLLDWEKELQRFLSDDDSGTLAGEWNATIEDIRSLTGDEAFHGAGYVRPEAPAESLWSKLASNKSAATYSGLAIADTGDAYLADMVTSAALRRFGYRFEWVLPAKADEAIQDRNPDVIIILGSVKVPRIKQLQENLLPAASNVGRLYDNQEYHTSFLWSIPASKNGPQIIWAASGGLEGTYEAVWHLVNVEWAKLINLSQMPPANGVELPHLGGTGIDLCKRSTQAFIKWKQQDRPVVAPRIARKLFDDLQALAESGKTVPQPCRECQVRDICEANLGEEGLGPIMRAPEMRKAVADLRHLTMSDGSLPSILIEGETGVGKDLAARYIHYLGKRKDGPYQHMNCANVSRELAESSLFGHIKGAFTGAERERLGVFRAADKGTLFLDEIAELPLDLQAKLLVALQNRQITPAGMDRSLGIDVHIIAATNKNLQEQVQSGQFRADLQFRLNGYRIAISPLRKRHEDMPCLIARILSNQFVNEPVEAVLPFDSFHRLLSYSWPGNVRELQSVLRAASIRAGKGHPILPGHLELGDERPTELAPAHPHRAPSNDAELQRLEDEYVSAAASDERDAATNAFRWRVSRNNPSDKVRLTRARILVELAKVHNAVRSVTGRFIIPKGTRVAESGELIQPHLASKLGRTARTIRTHLDDCDIDFG